MVFYSGTQNQQTRDELGSEPSIHTIPKVKTENILINPITLKTTTSTIGNSWIVGSSTNGIVGTNTGTQGGGQQVVGSSGQIDTVVRVINGNNTFFELFNNTTFEASGTSTADWGVTIGQLDVGSAEAAESLDIYRDTSNVVNATIILTITTGSLSNMNLELSPDAGANYESVTNNTLHTFTNTGNALRFKITNNSGTATISKVQIKYNLAGG